jgi:hypothetical protein
LPADFRLFNEAKRRKDANKRAAELANATLSDADLLAVGPCAVLDEPTKARKALLVQARTDAERDAQRAEVLQALATSPENVAARYLAGVLPPAELETALADFAFGKIALAVFKPLEETDLEPGECLNEDCKFWSEKYDGTMTAEQYSSWVRVCDLLVSLGFEPQLRRSFVKCKECNTSKTRLKVRICKTIGGVEVCREYSV